ncbi:hypothetical protein EON71_00830 [bacterium]|nr:MAG: hypothetical protein EON71_00830 [bacterium]
MSSLSNWHWSGFSVKSIIDNSFILKRNIDPRLTQNLNFFHQNKIVNQKCNTVQELVCATTAPKAFRVDSVSFNQSKYPIPFANNNFTCNFYFLSDISSKHVFSSNTRMELERAYNSVCAKNLASADLAAIHMVHESKSSFNQFRLRGDVESYNRIVVNTPKFFTLDFIRNIFY